MSSYEEVQQRIVAKFRTGVGEEEYHRLVQSLGDDGVLRLAMNQTVVGKGPSATPNTDWRHRLRRLGWLLLEMLVPGCFGALLAWLIPLGALAHSSAGIRLASGLGIGMVLGPVFWQAITALRNVGNSLDRLNGKPQRCEHCGGPPKNIIYHGKIPYHDHLGTLKHGSRGTIWQCKACKKEMIGPPLASDS